MAERVADVEAAPEVEAGQEPPQPQQTQQAQEGEVIRMDFREYSDSRQGAVSATKRGITKTTWIWIAVVSACVVVILALAIVLGTRKSGSSDNNPFGTVTKAECVLVPLAASYSGTITLTMNGNTLTMQGTIGGLPANTNHGIHIHQYGYVVRGSQGQSLGGHYNPDNTNHGCPDNARHAGDFGNITSDDQGTANFSLSSDMVSLSDRNPVLGRGIVIHTGQDDCHSNPAGDSGSRGAACTIALADNS